MKVVAGSGRAKEGGRQEKVEKQRQMGRNMQAGRLSGRDRRGCGLGKRQADRCNMAGRSMQSSRDRGRQGNR
jgi:hypothetical protein